LVDRETLYTPKVGYHHMSSLSSSFRKHLDGLAEQITRKFNLDSNTLVVDVGSNDGSLLESLQNRGVRFLGVDPTDITKVAIDKGLNTITEWFDESTADKIEKDYGKAKIITCLNTFAHTSHLDSIMKGIKKLLTEDGVFIIENQHLLDLIKDLQYDFIYHEHYRYYSVKSLNYLYNKFGMEIFDVEHVPTHGGSIRVFACKKGKHNIRSSVGEFLAAEERYGLNDFNTYTNFADRVKTHIEEFSKMLKNLRESGKTIMGLTASARAATLLNTCNIGPETLESITELSKLKIGKVSPGTHIKVVDQEVLFGDNAPDYGLLLSWHIKDEIIPRFRERGFKGKFIIPLPNPIIIDD